MEHFPEEAKKQIIHKLRNQMSGIRNRMRAKEYQKTLENDNRTFKIMIVELQNQIESLKSENFKLKEKIEILQNSKSSPFQTQN